MFVNVCGSSRTVGLLAAAELALEVEGEVDEVNELDVELPPADEDELELDVVADGLIDMDEELLLADEDVEVELVAEGLIEDDDEVELVAEGLIEEDDELLPAEENNEDVVEATGELVDEGDGDGLAELELELEVVDPGLLLTDELVVEVPEGRELELTIYTVVVSVWLGSV